MGVDVAIVKRRCQIPELHTKSIFSQSRCFGVGFFYNLITWHQKKITPLILDIFITAKWIIERKQKTNPKPCIAEWFITFLHLYYLTYFKFCCLCWIPRTKIVLNSMCYRKWLWYQERQSNLCTGYNLNKRILTFFLKYNQ